LGIVGSADPAVDDFRELKTLLPTLELRTVNGASHVETPARPEYLRAILDFLAAHT